ncbi:MAG: hypothetical protein ACJAVZ_002776 [Afipia broomeae]|jgi:hypothetical protein
MKANDAVASASAIKSIFTIILPLLLGVIREGPSCSETERKSPMIFRPPG